MAIPSRSLLAAVLLGLVPVPALAATLLVSHYNGNLYSLTLSGSKLSVTSSVKACGGMPSWLTLDAEGKTVYCTDESGAGSGSTLTALSVSDTGALKVSATTRTPGGELHSTTYGGSDGKGFLAVAEYDSSQISTFKLPVSGAALQRLKFTMSGRGPRTDRQDKPHPHSTFTDPTGKFLLSADLGADVIRVFTITPSSGELTLCATAPAGSGDGPRHGSFWVPKPGSTDGTMLYIVNELGNSMSTYSVAYTGSCLTLKKTQTSTTYAPGKTPPTGSKAAEVHVAGNFVYAVNRNDQGFGSQQDSVASYSIDPSSGAVTFIDAVNTHTYYPRTFQINKAGDMAAFAGQTSSNVVILSRDPATGKLGSQIAATQVGTAGRAGQEDGLSAVIWNE